MIGATAFPFSILPPEMGISDQDACIVLWDAGASHEAVTQLPVFPAPLKVVEWQMRFEAEASWHAAIVQQLITTWYALVAR